MFDACNGVSHILREGKAGAEALAKEGCLRSEAVRNFNGQFGS